MAALDTTARLKSVERTSAASWVTTASPAQCTAGGLGQLVQETGALTVLHERPGLVDNDQAAPLLGAVT